jgi:hypothetical protein
VIDATSTQSVVPARLRERIEEILRDRGVPVSAGPDARLRVAVDVTRELLKRADLGRSAALDLLAVDALVTQAMTMLTAAPEALDDRCLEAMRLLATIASDP